jgi:hypothetical protein
MDDRKYAAPKAAQDHFPSRRKDKRFALGGAKDARRCMTIASRPGSKGNDVSHVLAVP